MAVIRLAEAPPVRSARRFRLDTPSMLALQDRAGVPLPADIRVVLDPVEARVAGVDIQAVIDEGVTRLREHGVLDDEGRPLPAVLDNLRGLVGAPRRMRTTYAGPGRALVAYHWVGADLGGSVCRVGDRFEISLYDARSLGGEVSRLLPDHLVEEPDPRAPFVVPFDELGTLAAVEDRMSQQQSAPMAELMGLDADLLETARSWVRGFRGVLHSTVIDPDPGRPVRSLVWVAEQTGWWSLAPCTERGVRSARLEPRSPDELSGDLGVLLGEAWT